MVKVKICGITSMAEVDIVNRLQPDYCGFVFAVSKRQLTVARARQLYMQLSDTIRRVGVFVNQDHEEVAHIAAACSLDVIQLHGDETPEDCRLFSQDVWKVIRIRDDMDRAMVHQAASPFVQARVAGILLDTYSKAARGGTGKPFHWPIAADLGLPDNCHLILAGGLTPESVAAAIQDVKPHVVDVSSGVESNGGKSLYKVAKFIEQVRKGGSA